VPKLQKGLQMASRRKCRPIGPWVFAEDPEFLSFLQECRFRQSERGKSLLLKGATEADPRFETYGHFDEKGCLRIDGIQADLLREMISDFDPDGPAFSKAAAALIGEVTVARLVIVTWQGRDKREINFLQTGNAISVLENALATTSKLKAPGRHLRFDFQEVCEKVDLRPGYPSFNPPAHYANTYRGEAFQDVRLLRAALEKLDPDNIPP